MNQFEHFNWAIGMLRRDAQEAAAEYAQSKLAAGGEPREAARLEGIKTQIHIITNKE